MQDTHAAAITELDNMAGEARAAVCFATAGRGLVAFVLMRRELNSSVSEAVCDSKLKPP